MKFMKEKYSWQPSAWEKANCVFCQEKSKDVGHCSIDCPFTACKSCGIKGHLSIKCQSFKEQKILNKLRKLKKNKIDQKMQKMYTLVIGKSSKINYVLYVYITCLSIQFTKVPSAKCHKCHVPKVPCAKCQVPCAKCQKGQVPNAKCKVPKVPKVPSAKCQVPKVPKVPSAKEQPCISPCLAYSMYI